MRFSTLLATLITGTAASASLYAADTAIAPADPALGRKVEFFVDVFPILEAKCLACHNVTNKESDLVLENVAAILKGGASGPGVVAGKPDESLIYKLAARSEDPVMPPTPNKAEAKPLTPREVGILRKWIEEGATAGTAAPPSSDIAWRAIPETITSVYSLTVSPDQRFIAAGRANRIFIYDLPQQKEVARLTDPSLLALVQDGKPLYGPGTSHRDFVHSMAFSPNGNLLATGSFREIKLWERTATAATAKLEPGAPIVSTAIAADDTLAALVLNNNTVRLFNLQNGQAGATLTGHEGPVKAAAFSPDGKLVATGSDDSSVRTWNVADGAMIAKLPMPKPVTALSFNKDGTQLIAGHADNVIRLWATPTAAVDPAAPAPMRLWNLDNGGQQFNQNLGAPVSGVAVSADGQFVAGSAENNIARVWQRNGQQKCEVKGDPLLDRQVAFLTDELTVAKNKVTLNDNAVKEGEKDITGREDSLKKANEAKPKAEMAVVEQQKKVTEAETKAKAAADALAAKADDAGLKKANDDAAAALKKENEALQQAKDGVVSADRAIQLSQQSLDNSKKRLEELKASLVVRQAESTKAEEAANAAKAQAQMAPKPQRSVALSADGQVLVTAGDDNAIRLWHAQTGTPLQTITGHTAPVSSLKFLGSGALLSAGADQTAQLWDIKPQWKLIATLGSKPENALDLSASPHADRVLSLAFSPDGTRLASGGGDPSRSGELLIWNVANRTVERVVADAHSDTVYDVKFSRDGKLLVSGAADKFVKVFEVETGKFVRSFEGHTNHVLGVAFKADGSNLVSSGADNAIKVWNFETGEQIRTITNATKQVTAINYIGVSDNIVSASGDKTVRFHTASNGGNYRNFGGSADYLYTVYASGDETYVITAGEDGLIRVWNGKNGQEITKFPHPTPAAETVAK
jgi:WD40 repeat protein